MKKVLWLSPVSTGSTSLDAKVNPHDIDALAQSELMRKQGYEIYLLDPYEKKKMRSSWKNQIEINDLHGFSPDVVILSLGPFLIDYLQFKYWAEKDLTNRAQKLDIITNWLDHFQGELYTMVTDPRPSFQDVFFKERKKDHGIFKHIDRAKILVADPSFLQEPLRKKSSITDYWKTVNIPIHGEFSPTKEFFAVYVGVKAQLGSRKKQIRDWFSDKEGCYTAGQISITGIPSLSAYEKVSLQTALDLTSRSVTTLICGEPGHTWLTPRIIQSLCSGSICSIHPDFRGARHLPKEIVEEQVFAMANDFDHSLNSEKIYQRQVEFVMSLCKTAQLTGLE